MSRFNTFSLVLPVLVLFAGCMTEDPQVFSAPGIKGPVPWTEVGFKADPDNFQFAVVSDRFGGGSGLTGIKKGQFDHIVWVTMTSAGPKIANLMLYGIHGEDVKLDE